MTIAYNITPFKGRVVGDIKSPTTQVFFFKNKFFQNPFLKRAPYFFFFPPAATGLSLSSAAILSKNSER